MRLVELVLAQATRPGSSLHGERHWRAVAHAGLELAEHVPGADAGVVFLFALFHDAQRRNEGHDPEHGPRAAAFAERLHGDAFRLPADGLGRLLLACHEHADGGTSDDPTIAVCFDADRLNLWRVGTKPRRRYLSTEPARERTRIAAACDWHDAAPAWGELVGRLARGSGAG